MEKIQKLSKLYYELAALLDNYGKTYHDYFLIKSRLNSIQDYLNKIEIANDNIANVINELKMINDRFYSNRGGLTDFVITIDDKKEEERLNKKLELIQKDIDDILN